LLGFLSRFPRNQPIQRRLPPHHPVNQLLAKPAVGWGKPRLGQLAFQQILDKPATLPALQNPDCNFSWCLAAHNL
jgi:hypothetical protein